MIQKLELQNIISKYHLNGLIEAVKWEIKDNQLNIKFNSPSKEMIGFLESKDFNIIDSNIGIHNTSQLLKLIGITNGELSLDYIKQQKIYTKLIISDKDFTLNYSLADIMTIPKSGTYGGSENYNLETSLDIDIINSLIKAKSALTDSETLVIKPTSNFDGDFQLELIFGGDEEYANKVSFYLSNFVKDNVPPEFELHFNSELLKEILYCNKDMNKGKLYINLEGLMKLEFETEKTKSVYYLVQKEI